MSTLFETGKTEIPKEELIRVLQWGRNEFDHSEDDWEEEELSAVRKELMRNDTVLATFSLTRLKILLQRIRKDKLARIRKEALDFLERLNKLSRDFEKSRQGEPRDHSQEYDALMCSDEWRNRAISHKRLCEGRCQLCGRVPSGKLLDCHHTPMGYEHLGKEETHHLLCLCEDCHLIADLIRQTRGSDRIIRALLRDDLPEWTDEQESLADDILNESLDSP